MVIPPNSSGWFPKPSRFAHFKKCSEPGVFCAFWLGNVLRTTTACTFSSGPRPSVFNTFDFEMCFAPQRHAPFPHLNFQKRSDPGVVCTFWLGNVLRAAAACNFHSSSDQMSPHPPLRRAYFSTLRSHKSLEKHCESQLFYFFRAPASAFFRLFLFSDLLSSSLTLPAFPSVHIVGSLTSKLPSATIFLSLSVWLS